MSNTSIALAPSAPSKPAAHTFDVGRVREDFPILKQLARGKPLVYLDNAATTQKPQAVIDTIVRYYTEQNANVHRGVHMLSERATMLFEEGRERVRWLLNASCSKEIVFTRGATEGINLVAQAYARPLLTPGDEIVVSAMEHHSNIVPWQMVCEQTGAILRVIPINEAGELDLEAYERMLGPRTRIVAVVQLSNSLGTINPVARIIEMAHRVGAVVLVDGAQAVSHLEVDVRALDCDFYVLSGHKLFGPTGIGALYGKQRILEAMPPWQGGGDMIRSVTFERTTYSALPSKFEAGTPHIEGVLGLGAAIDYVRALGLPAVAAHERELLQYGTALLQEIPGLWLIGTARDKASVLSFVLEDVHPHDVGTILDQQGIAVRTGQHCTQPVMDHFGIPATTRASLAFYNTKDELDALAAGVRKVVEMFR